MFDTAIKHAIKMLMELSSGDTHTYTHTLIHDLIHIHNLTHTYIHTYTPCQLSNTPSKCLWNCRQVIHTHTLKHAHTLTNTYIHTHAQTHLLNTLSPPLTHQTFSTQASRMVSFSPIFPSNTPSPPITHTLNAPPLNTGFKNGFAQFNYIFKHTL